MRKIHQTAHASLLIFIFSLVLLAGCKHKNKPQGNPTGKATRITAAAFIQLPDRNFDVEQFGENEIKNQHPLNNSEIKKLQIAEIDRPLYQEDVSDFKYYLLKEMYQGKESKIVLISRNSENENFAWLATYDAQNKLVDFKTVYYDEWAESAVRTTSVIKNNKITISQLMLDFETGKENKKINTFYISKDLKFVADNP